jgi:hypothetical protein
VDNKRLADDIDDAEAWVERAEWVLEDDLEFAAGATEFGAAHGEKVAAVVADGARGRFDKAEDETTEGTFTRAGFAHEAKGFAGLNVERNVVDSAKLSTGPGAEGVLPVRVDLGEGANREKRHGEKNTVESGKSKVASWARGLPAFGFQPQKEKALANDCEDLSSAR